MQMGLEYSLWIISVFLMIVVFVMALGYTYAQKGQMHGFPGKVRFGMFGVMSFVFIGMLFISYIAYLFIMEGTAYSYIFVIGEHSYDLANGFWTVLIGTSVGIFLGIFALLKKQELFMR